MSPLPGLYYAPGTSPANVWCGPRSLSYWLLSPSPFSKEWGSLWGCECVDYRFGLKCISFPDGIKVLLVCKFVCSLSQVSCFLVGLMWRFIGGCNSALLFLRSFYL